MGNKRDNSSVKNAIGDTDIKGKKSKKSTKESTKKSSKTKLPSMGDRISDERFVKLSGLFLLFFSAYLFLAFTSYFISWFSWDADDVFSNISLSRILFDQELIVHNFTGRFGAAIAQIFIKNWFGIASYLFLYLMAIVGLRRIFAIRILSLKRALKHSLFTLVWLSISLGFFFQGDKISILGGLFGHQTSQYLTGLIGKSGTVILIVFSLVSFLLYFLVYICFLFFYLVCYS